MSIKNRYGYPQCPFCHGVGGIVESDIKKCAHTTCEVDLYWSGGYTLLDKSYYRPVGEGIPLHVYKHTMRN